MNIDNQTTGTSGDITITTVSKTFMFHTYHSLLLISLM
jgi:hypothetical protein